MFFQEPRHFQTMEINLQILILIYDFLFTFDNLRSLIINNTSVFSHYQRYSDVSNAYLIEPENVVHA